MSDSSAKTAAVRYELVAEAVQDPGTTDPIVVVRKALRGRIKRALVLAILFGITGTILGYVAVPPVYESTGLIRIHSSLPAVLYEETNAQFSEPFETFAESQATMIVSRDVLSAAVRNPQLQQLGWPEGDQGAHQLSDALNVSRERGHQYMSVAIAHCDPEIAQVAVNAVLTAYAEQVGSHDQVSPQDIEAFLVQREQELASTLLSLRNELLTASDQYGLDMIRDLHAEKIEQLKTIDQKLTSLDRAISELSNGLEQGDVRSDSQAIQQALSTFALGINETSSDLAQREQTLLAEIESWNVRYGPNHPMIRELNRQLDVVRLRMHKTTGSQQFAGGDLPDSNASADSLLNRLFDLEQTYLTMRDSVLTEATELGRRHVTLTGIEENVAGVQERLTETRKRLDAIRVENGRSASSRISIAAVGAFPLSPIKDRRQGLAAAAGLFGALFGTAIVVFVGLIDQRCHYADQLAHSLPGTPILCRLPDLSSNDPADVNRSAVAVHQLRHSLQISHSDKPNRVITVTSCGPGEGKTSLALALGSSFAGSGARTLLIDADPRNRAITHQFHLEHLPGLYEAVRGDHSSGEIVSTDSENLWVLPIGAVSQSSDALLSQQNLRWLLEAVADRFDSILIDTGPVPTSIEASASCSVADIVMLVVARDQSSRLVRDAVERAQHCTAGRIGLVYNRARPNDVRVVEDEDGRVHRDITSLVPGAVPQHKPTAGSIGKQTVNTTHLKQAA